MYTTIQRLAGPFKVTICKTKRSVVAVKVFGQFLSVVQQELIVRESRAARQVSRSHKCILPFLGTADVGQQTAIVSVYMRNGNLTEYIKAHKDCNKTRLIRQVAEAVNFLHTERNLVHGDIKCANVLVSDSGNARLADFGLSTFIERDQTTVPTMTAIRDMYTLRFAAPELLTGGSPAGPVGAESACEPNTELVESAMQRRSKTRESDVYAFGMLVLEVATQKPPWHGLNHTAVLFRVSTGQHPPRPLDGTLVSMSHAAWELCLSCWRVDPTERIMMANVLEALRVSWSNIIPAFFISEGVKLNGFDIGPVKIVKTHNFVKSISYMPNGRHIVCGYFGGVVQIWDTRTGLAVAGPMRGHTKATLCIATSPNGLEIASSSLDRTIRRWDAASGTPIGDPIDLETAAFGIGYSADSHYLAYGERECVHLRHTNADRQAGGKLRGHTGWVTAIAFSPDGAHLASGSVDRTVRIWDMATRATLSVVDQENWIYSLAFSPDGARLAAAAASSSLTARVWNCPSGCLELEFDAQTGHSRSVAFSPATHCVAGSVAGMIRLWDTRTGLSIGVQSGGCPDASVTFSQGGRSLVSSADGGGILIRDLFA